MAMKKRRRPERRAQVADLRAQRAKAITTEVRDSAASLSKTVKSLEPLLSSGKRLSEGTLKLAEASAKSFLEKRAEMIRQRRKYVESSVAAGKSPSLQSIAELHASYIEATQLLKEIEKQRKPRK